MIPIFAADDPRVLDGTYDQEGYQPGERVRIAKTRARIAAHEEAHRMAKKRKAAKPTKPAKDAKVNNTRSSRPRQQDLPGTEDRAIKPLEDVAEAYADLRDRRIELNREEAELKVHVKKLMHKYDKTIYRREGIEIRLIDGEEDVKVKVRKPGDDAPADEQQDHDAAEAENASSAEDSAEA